MRGGNVFTPAPRRRRGAPSPREAGGVTCPTHVAPPPPVSPLRRRSARAWMDAHRAVVTPVKRQRGQPARAGCRDWCRELPHRPATRPAVGCLARPGRSDLPLLETGCTTGLHRGSLLRCLHWLQRGGERVGSPIAAGHGARGASDGRMGRSTLGMPRDRLVRVCEERHVLDSRGDSVVMTF